MPYTIYAELVTNKLWPTHNSLHLPHLGHSNGAEAPLTSPKAPICLAMPSDAKNDYHHIPRTFHRLAPHDELNRGYCTYLKVAANHTPMEHGYARRHVETCRKGHKTKPYFTRDNPRSSRATPLREFRAPTLNLNYSVHLGGRQNTHLSGRTYTNADTIPADKTCHKNTSHPIVKYSYIPQTYHQMST